jgi:hypothetical protein
MANKIVTEIKHVDVNNSNINCDDVSEDIVNPWNVVSKSETGIDYDKLISKYISRACTNCMDAKLGL